MPSSRFLTSHLDSASLSQISSTPSKSSDTSNYSGDYSADNINQNVPADHSQTQINYNASNIGYNSVPTPLRNPFDSESSTPNSSASLLAPTAGSLNFIYNDAYRASNIGITADLSRYPVPVPVPFGSSVSRSALQYLNDSSYSVPNERGSANNIYNNSNSDREHDIITSPFGGFPATDFPLTMDDKEADDYIHNPDPILDAKLDLKCSTVGWNRRTYINLSGFLFIVIGLLVLFVLLPVLTFSNVTTKGRPESYEILTEYSYPLLSGIRTNLVDSDTPDDALTREALDGSKWKLVFSDEFNAVGRTFYEGDDQFWTAVDLHYAATEDLEWSDPDSIQTSNGTLKIRMDAYKNHDLFYRSGNLQSWNKLCFTQGIYEVSAKLPGHGKILGFWPGIWTMGNLGRPGYLSTTDGVWPYSYNECDAGITPNQSSSDGISYLLGQRLNKCTCDGEDHPNQGTGRGAPEIDALEGANDAIIKNGVVSQSLQVAPYDIWYIPNYEYIEIYNKSITNMNSYTGGPFQQAISGLTTLNTLWYENTTDKSGDSTGDSHFQTYSFEYLNDDKDGYVRFFVGDDATYTLYSNALQENGNVGQRLISKEPMSMILNFGISNSWTYIDWTSLQFPSTMEIDYVRVYQPTGSVSVTCDPSDYPTYDYINDHPKAYKNVNLTTWESTEYGFPKNKLMSGC